MESDLRCGPQDSLAGFTGFDPGQDHSKEEGESRDDPKSMRPVVERVESPQGADKCYESQCHGARGDEDLYATIAVVVEFRIPADLPSCRKELGQPMATNMVFQESSKHRSGSIYQPDDICAMVHVLVFRGGNCLAIVDQEPLLESIDLRGTGGWLCTELCIIQYEVIYATSVLHLRRRTGYAGLASPEWLTACLA